jgi:hypothetical protein
VFAWLIIINLSYSSYQDTRATDALAEVKVLFPHFYIVIALFAALCIYVYWKRIDNKWLHVALLIEFALMLWWTPYIMSGFVREPDGIWHSGISLNIQSVLSGVPFAFTSYAAGYPGSFLFNKAAIEISGVNVAEYAGWLYPLFYTVIFIFIWYIFAMRFFNKKIAYLSGIIAIPALYYIKIHPSPQTIGVILIFFTLTLLITHEGVISRVLGLIGLFIMLISHPISPILTLIFLAVAYFPKFWPRIKSGIFERRTTIMIYFLAIIIILILFFLFTSLGQYILQYSQRLFDQPLDRGFALILKFLIGSPFIYSEIYLLTQLIHIGYACIAIAILYCIVTSSSQIGKKGIRFKISNIIKKAGYKNGVLLAASLLYIVFTIFLIVITNAFVLIERGLSLFIIFISLFIASNSINLHKSSSGKKNRILNKKNRTYIASSIILIVVVTYPVVSYSIDAYNSFPQSENHGLLFLTSHVSLDNKNITMGSQGQLSAYTEPPTNYEYIYFNQDILLLEPDIIIFRNSYFFYMAMRFNLSFEDNLHTRIFEEVNQLQTYNLIYSSGTFEVFIKDDGSL